ncbi:carbohydrate ABC transporter permease [Ruminiclostridium cellobioparum]|uniref:carbohydrate ABC transporter permease n=1 Tax=Ruminiclostridium cellobioparum TaxID=29355 RepID=UPI000686393C|nr:carbohydrate ABC transporter permease [Ruminiclostridium cellobioparum]
MDLNLNKDRKIGEISGFSNFFINLIFLIISLVCILPIVFVIIISFTNEQELLVSGYTFFPKEISFDAYSYIVAAGDVIWRAYGVSIFVTIVGTILSLLIICMYAYPLSRSSFRYKTQFAFLAYFTMIFGGGLVPWYIVYTTVIPIKNSIWIMIVPYLMNAWYVIIMRTFYKTTVHESIIESAKIDGAGEFRTFFVVVLPLCRAGLATIGLFCTLNYWNDWYLPLVFVNNAKLYNIQYFMYQTLQTIQFLATSSTSFSNAGLAMQSLPSEGARMAIAVLSIGPIILAYPFFQRYFVKGLTVGAVKG